jgi:ribosome-associated protein
LNTQVKVKRRLNIDELNQQIIESIQEIKGRNIVKLDLRRLNESPADMFIICEGTSTTQVKAISDNVQRRVRERMNVAPSHVEGERNALWICIDYFNIVVHVFHPEARIFYELEDLWGDATITEYDSL